MPTVEQFSMYQEAADGLIRYITLAPEHDPDFALTKHCRETGVVVSMGHSSATYEQALMAVANGATSMTHVYNGMTPYHHRKPGLVGTALRLRDIYGEIIGDGQHSHLAALNNYMTAKGRDYAILISDSLRAEHCPPGGDYELGGHPVEIRENGLAYLKGTDTIAGKHPFHEPGTEDPDRGRPDPGRRGDQRLHPEPGPLSGRGRPEGQAGCRLRCRCGVVLEDSYEVVQTYCRGKAMLLGNAVWEGGAGTSGRTDRQGIGYRI